jgi:hypothetical protein
MVVFLRSVWQKTLESDALETWMIRRLQLGGLNLCICFIFTAIDFMEGFKSPAVQLVQERGLRRFCQIPSAAWDWAEIVGCNWPGLCSEHLCPKPLGCLHTHTL